MDLDIVLADLEELESRLSRFVERTRDDRTEAIEFRKNKAEIKDRLRTAIEAVDLLIEENQSKKPGAKKTRKKTKTAV